MDSRAEVERIVVADAGRQILQHFLTGVQFIKTGQGVETLEELAEKVEADDREAVKFAGLYAAYSITFHNAANGVAKRTMDTIADAKAAFDEIGALPETDY